MNNIKYNAVLFDLDGTLLDTANDLGEALNFVLAKHSLPIVSRDQYRPVASDGAKGLLTLGFKEKLAEYHYENLRQEFLEYYIANLAVHTCLYSGIADMLNELNKNNIPWGIVTNKPESITHKLLPHFNALDKSQAVVGGDTLPERKPHPAPMFFACQQMDIDPTTCLYIGDAPRDIEAGNAANMFSIVAQWGYIANKEDCLNWQADAIAKEPADILKYIL